ncbi:tripartite ATP-independent periplasmic transporter solute receptor, DctP family [Desulfosporosinus orientis DSM 765]|uniref:Tripartite ATP-independent periplasmic transporter solute receptor, DctP family n=1 Tax=Desulfosporosinus orientis (strain ATCC 19365 / DSM 765 / NCIMB 8382 / VKM B-1628 / Singapore I) TaxID=768706 RepID=G7WEZ5_DESOD|nr:DctP family TRAP transporter solute-binding subunit [Desulfosporosinus orientis]AET67324.1 tripartite ATP-independent periplasmic transporter solute receptor, DctP family [Desulfosporosinus orientis DSM 765]
MAWKRWSFIILFLLLGLPGCESRVIDGQQVNRKEKIIIRFSHVVAENTPKGLAAIRFARLISERSGGTIEIQVFPDSQLFKDGEEFEALSRGDVEMIAPATSKISQLLPEWQIWDLPYLFSNLESVHQVMDGPVGRSLLKQLEEKNMVGLAMWDNGFKNLTNNIHPILSPVDFNGLSFRVMSPGILEDQFTYFGADTVLLPFNDVYKALQDGTVQGQENTISNIYTKRFSQVQKYLTLSQHGFLGYAVVMNKTFWDQLPGSARELIEKTMAEVTLWERETAERLNEVQLEEIEKNNLVTIHTLTNQEKTQWKKDFSSVYDKFEENNDSKLLEEAQKWSEPKENN